MQSMLLLAAIFGGAGRPGGQQRTHKTLLVRTRMKAGCMSWALDTLLHVGLRDGSPLKEVQNAANNSDTLSTDRAAASC